MGKRGDMDAAIRAWWVTNVVANITVAGMFYTGYPENPPGGGVFVVFRIDWTSTTQTTLGLPGSRDFRYRGFLDVQVAGPIEGMDQPLYTVIDEIEDRCKASAPSGVVFESPSIQGAITDGASRIMSIRVPFYSDQRA